MLCLDHHKAGLLCHLSSDAHCLSVRQKLAFHEDDVLFSACFITYPNTQSTNAICVYVLDRKDMESLLAEI